MKSCSQQYVIRHFLFTPARPWLAGKILRRFYLVFFIFNLAPLFAGENGTFRDREFVFAFLPNSNATFILEIHTVGTPGTEVTLVYGNDEPQVNSIPASGRLIFTVSEEAGKIENWANSGSGAADKMAIRITAGDDILCYAINGARASGDGAIVLPLSELKTFYEVITYDRNGETLERDQAVFAIVAAYDSTEIILNPSQEITNQLAENEHGTYTVSLMKDEALLVRSKGDSTEGNLSGSIVIANHPVAIINGNRCTRIPAGVSDCDHIFEMAQPIQSWGDSLLVAGLPTRPSGMSYEIVAFHPNTEVFIDGELVGIIDNNNRSIKIDTLTGDHLITANNPIFVSQFMPGSVTDQDVSGDPFMTNIIPIKQFVAVHDFVTPDYSTANPIYDTNQITLFIDEQDLSSIQIDDITIAPEKFARIPATSFYTATLTLAPGKHRSTTENADHGLIVSGYGNATAYAYPAGDSLAIINKGHDNRSPAIKTELENHVAHGVASDDSLSEDSNNNGLLDNDEDLNSNGKLDIDYGLEEIYLLPNSNNVKLVMTKPFTPGDKKVEFDLRLIDTDFPGSCTIVARDLSGNLMEKTVVIPECDVILLNTEILVPTLADSVTLSIFPKFKGDDPIGYTKTMHISNGEFEDSFAFVPNETLDVHIALFPGANNISIFTEYLSGQLQATSCRTDLEILRVDTLKCEGISFSEPQDINILAESAHFVFSGQITGGYILQSQGILINTTTGDTITAVQNGATFSAEMPLVMGINNLRAEISTSDSLQQFVQCAQDLQVFRPFPFDCGITEVTPDSGLITIADSILITAKITVDGGITPYQDSCTVNGILTPWVDGAIAQKVPLYFGVNSIEIRSKFVDDYGQITECFEQTTVIRPRPLICRITDISHPDGLALVDSTILFQAKVYVTGGLNPIIASAEINGEKVTITDSIISKQINLGLGLNEINIKTMYIDSLGQSSYCDSTIVLNRPKPVTCNIEWLNQEPNNVTIDSLVILKAKITSSGGLAPITTWVLINDSTVAIINDSLAYTLKLDYGENDFVIRTFFTDSLGQSSRCDTTISFNRITPPRCEITSMSPADSAITLARTLPFKAKLEVKGGLKPVIKTAAINGDPVFVFDGVISTNLSLDPGVNIIKLTTLSTDMLGQETTCDSTIIITRVDSLQCKIVSITPADGLVTTQPEITFTARVNISGGLDPVSGEAFINGEPVDIIGGIISKKLLLEFGKNEIILRTTYIDSIQQITRCDTTLVFYRAEPLHCEFTQVSPADQAETSLDSALIAAEIKTSGGWPPISGSGIIDGQLVEIIDGKISLKVPLNIGENEIELHAAFNDSLGQSTACDTTITIKRKDPIICKINEIRPNSGTSTAADSINFYANVSTTGGLAPIIAAATINGDTVKFENNIIAVKIALNRPGQNEIVLHTFFSDSLEQTTSCDTAILINRVGILTCDISAVTPGDDLQTLANSIQFSARVNAAGGLAPVFSTATINSEPVEIIDGVVAKEMILNFGPNDITLQTSFTDSLGQLANCDTTITVNRVRPLGCEIAAISPADGFKTANNSVIFSARVLPLDGLAPFIGSATINGEPVAITDSVVTREIPLKIGENTISLQVAFSDSLGQESSCETNINVQRPAAPGCVYSYISIPDSYSTRAGSVLLEAGIRGESTVKIIASRIWLNSRLLGRNIFDISEIVNLRYGNNEIILTSEFTDELGQSTRCDKTINVFRIPPDLSCKIANISVSKSVTIANSITLTAEMSTSGGIAPIFATATINGDTAKIINGKIQSDIALELGRNTFNIAVDFYDSSPDSLQQRTKCEATVTAFRADSLGCEISNISPKDGAVTTAEKLTFSADVNPLGGWLPISASATINGENIDINDGRVERVITLQIGSNEITLQTSFSDSLGQIANCDTTITLIRSDSLGCEISNISHVDGWMTAASFFTFSANAFPTGGVPPFTEAATLNGKTVEIVDCVVSEKIALNVGVNEIHLQTSFSDSLGQTSICDTTITVIRGDSLSCEISSVSPVDGWQTTATTVIFSAVVKPIGGYAPITGTASLNGFVIQISDSAVSRELDLQIGKNTITLETLFSDSLQQLAKCDTMITVYRIQSDPMCAVRVLSPADGDTIRADSVVVTVESTVTGGTPPLSRECNVNGFPVIFPVGSIVGTVKIPLVTGVNSLIASSTYTDSSGRLTACSDSISIPHISPPAPVDPSCNTRILVPQNGSFFDVDSLEITVLARFTPGVPAAPLDSGNITVNGIPVYLAEKTDTIGTVKIALVAGLNTITLSSTFNDSLGRTSTCTDIITVTRAAPPPQCSVEVTAPDEGFVTANDSVNVTISASLTGGQLPVTAEWTVNGRVVELDLASFTGQVTVPLLTGSNGILAVCSFSDSLGRSTTCRDSITVEKTAPELTCALDFFKPEDGEIIYSDSVLVMGSLAISGGIAPFDSSVSVNGLPVSYNTDGSFYLSVPLQKGENSIVAEADISDVSGQNHTCSIEIQVFRPENLACTVSIVEPADSITVSSDSSATGSDSLLVIAQAEVSGGVLPYADSTCAINGVPASLNADGYFQAKVAIANGLNKISVTCAFTDADSMITACSDTLVVFGDEFRCDMTIISPDDGHKQCSAHFNTYIDLKLSGAVGPTETWCIVNGDTAEVTDDGLLYGHTVLAPGYNAVIINSTSIDSLGRRAVCIDTLTVFVDRTPAQGELDRTDPPTVRGRVFDWESGIASIEIVSQSDADIQIDGFEPGQKQVNFVAYRTGQNSGPSFVLRITNGTGCVMEYDPISIRIEPSETCDFSFIIPQVDRYLNIDNFGIHKIHFRLNGRQIDFVADEQGTEIPGEIYYIPLTGARTIDLHDYLDAGDNDLDIWCEGPAGSYAEIFIADVRLSRQTTSVEIENRRRNMLPDKFALNQNYPNPFNMRTIISFSIPNGWTKPVKLVLYNAKGQLVKTLFDEKVLPGNYRVWWDGTDETGMQVASGMYLYRIVSGRNSQVKKLLLTK